MMTIFHVLYFTSLLLAAVISPATWSLNRAVQCRGDEIWGGLPGFIK